MSKHRVIVLKILTRQLTVSEAANAYGLSRRHLHRLLARAHAEGIDAVEPRSRRPRTNPTAVDPELRDRIIRLRRHLTANWRNQQQKPGRWPSSH